MRNRFRLSAFFLAPVLAVGTVLAQGTAGTTAARLEEAGTLRGRVIDATGGALPGATVTLTDIRATTVTVAADATGRYAFGGLAPGRYTLHALLSGFAPYENTEVDIAAGRTATTIRISLNLAPIKEEITITRQGSTFQGSTVVLPGDSELLPDDPDDLAADLEALAGSSTASQGTQMFVDGFSGARLPPKASIREFRTNQNPYSAANDKVGFGKIEVFTKPGSDKLRGQAFFNFGHGIFNSRNPFFYPTERPLFRESFYGGNLGGPFGKRASFVVDVESREIVSSAIIDAVVLDADLNIKALHQAVNSPQRRSVVSPRIDHQLNQGNTLVGRYMSTRIGRSNVGIGEFSLPVRAYRTSETEHLVQLTETAVLGSQAINETRLQFVRNFAESRGDNSAPTINVSDAFVGGGAEIGRAFISQNRWEIQNYTQYLYGAHSQRWGARLRAIAMSDVAPLNFGGTFRFSSGTGPQLDAGDQVLLDAAGRSVTIPLTALERYRRTILFQSQGMTGAQVRALGGGASQFSITTGAPRADVSQADLGLFFQDDWTVRPEFRLSLGLRYEWQNNIHFWKDLAPRISLAWAPGDLKARKTALRFGLGVFYDRFSEKLVLQAVRLDGVNQQQYLVRNPNVFPAVLPLQTLGDPLPPAIRRVAPDLRAPYIVQTSMGIERLLPFKTTVTSTFTSSRGLHLLRSRNINAPLPGTFVPGDATSGVRPYGPGNIFVYESTGRLNQGQWNTNLTSRFHKNLTLTVLYLLNYANSDTDGPATFPADPFDDSVDYGRSILDERHRLVLNTTIAAPGGFQFSPSFVARSGTPFNITSGRDTNGDTLLTERPAFATQLNNPGAVITPFGALISDPPAGEETLPRNYAQTPGYFNVNVRLSRNVGFGKRPVSKGATASAAEPPYTVTFTFSVRNLLNRRNPAKPVGTLTSPVFGTAASLADAYASAPEAGNRRVDLQMRLKF